MEGERNFIQTEPPAERDSSASVENLIAALANNEAKAITYLSMRPEIVYTDSMLEEAVHQAQGDKPAWPISKRALFNYCRTDFEPIGLVAYEVNGLYGTYGYVVRDEEREIAEAVAGSMLRLSEQHPDYGLYNIFSRTATTSTVSSSASAGDTSVRRPVELRIAILRYLHASQSFVSLSDAARATNTDRIAVGQHLKDLSECGLLAYETKKYGLPVFYYEIKDDRPNSQPSGPKGSITLTEQTLEVLTQYGKGKLTREEIALLLFAHDPELEKVTSVRARLSSVLIELEKQGYLTKEGKQESAVIMTLQQRQLITYIIEMIDALVRRDPAAIEEAREYARQLIANPGRVNSLMAKAYEKSRHAAKIPPLEAERTVLELIANNPGITFLELAELSRRDHTNISRHLLRRIVQRLERSKRVTGGDSKLKHFTAAV